MDCKNVVAVNDRHSYSSLLEEAVVLVRQVLNIECPLIPDTALHKHPDTEVILIPFFKGEVYENVRKLGKPLIGPAAMIFLIKQEILMPRRLKNGQNLYSLSLQGTRVCCSNIDKETRDMLYSMAVSMGGTTSPALTSEVTHLVVEEVGSQKYKFAAKLGIPIMSPDWLTTIWEMSKSQVVKNDRILEEQYQCPCFRGCTVCVTGLDMAQRTEVEDLVNKHGGSYNGDLVMEKCTHLLVDTPEGKKFTYAQKWKIPCVKTKWFYDSIAKGICLDIEDYRHVPASNMSFSEVSYLVKPMLEETRDCGSVNVTLPVGASQSDILKQLQNLDLTRNKDKGYLDGCRIYLSGFSSTEQDLLKRILNNGGGMRLDVISPRVTHIVTNTTVIKELEQLREKQPDAAIVSLQWLIDSMEKGMKQPDTNYDVLPTTDVTSDNPLPNLRPIFNRTKSTDTTKDTIIEQYTDVTMAPSDVTMAPSDVTMAPSDVTVAPSDVTNNLTTSVIDRTKQNTTADILQKSTKEQPLFEGYAFHITKNIDTKIARNVQQQLITNGGSCRPDNVDFCVVDPFKEVPSYCEDKTIVTYMWVQRCIQSSELLSLKSCPLFTPNTVPRNSRILKGCVISYSQFSGFELAHIVKVIETLGGVAQGTFSHRPIVGSKRMEDCLACTHLIYKNKNSKKHGAALKWKLPSVTVDWLYQCLLTKSLVNTAPFEDHSAIREKEIVDIKKAKDIIKEVVPRDGAGVIVTAKGNVHKYDNEGFITPVKIKNNPHLQVDDVMKALESPASTQDTNKSFSSLGTMYKKNLSNALKKTTPVSKILSGVTLVIKQGKLIEVPLGDVRSTARRNGAYVKNVIDRTCTHVVCGVKEMKESNIEQAMKQGVKVVSCYWVMACDEQATRLPEHDYPPGIDPKRALNMSVTEDITVPAVEINNEPTPAPSIPVDPEQHAEEDLSLDHNLQKEISMLEKLQTRTSCEESGEFAHPGTPRSAARKHKRSMIRKITPIDVPIDQLLSQKPLSVTYEDGQTDRKTFLENEVKLSSSINKPTSAPILIQTDPSVTSSTRSDKEKPTKPPYIDNKTLSSDDERKSVSDDVRKSVSDDVTKTEGVTKPDGTKHGPTDNIPDDTLNSSRALALNIAPTSTSTPNKPPMTHTTKQRTDITNPLEGIDTADLEISDLSLDKSDTRAENIEPPKPRNFLMSGLNPKEKDEFTQIIEELGGNIIQCAGFDPSCTHLIVAKPNRNEKYISGVGSGIWVLHPTYLTASKNKGAWCDEQSFVWACFAPDLRGIQKHLAISSGMWIGKKAFTGWNVMFCMSSGKVNSFKGIIESGGGKVPQTRPPYNVQSGLTHAFVDVGPKNSCSEDVPLRALVEANVPCLKLEYLPVHLNSPGNIEIRNSYIIEPALILMKASAKNKRSCDTSLHGTPSKRSKT